MRKRTNRSQAPNQVFLVGDGDQVVVTGGDLNTSGSTLNISSLQFGVLSADPDGTVTADAFIPAGTVPPDVRAIRVIQGTPYSSQLSKVSPFGDGHRGYVRSHIIRADGIRAISTELPSLPRFHAVYLRSVSGLATSTRYRLNLTFEGVRTDITYGMNREVVDETVTTPSSAPTNMADWVLQNLALELNRQSQFVGPNPNGAFAGNKPFVVFGIKASGGSGTTIGTLTKDTAAFDFAKYTVGGQTVQATFKTDMNFINSMNAAIGSVAGLSTATIENLGDVAPGSAATIDGLLIIATREEELGAFDNIKELGNRVQVGFGTDIGATQPIYTQSVVCAASEGVNTGRQVFLDYKDRADLQILTMQNHPKNNEYFIEPVNYIDKNVVGYTATRVEHFGETDALQQLSEHPKEAVILLEAEIDDDTADADTGYTLLTIDTTTVTALNNILAAWLAGAETYSDIVYKGEAVSGTVFV